MTHSSRRIDSVEEQTLALWTTVCARGGEERGTVPNAGSSRDARDESSRVESIRRRVLQQLCETFVCFSIRMNATLKCKQTVNPLRLWPSSPEGMKRQPIIQAAVSNVRRSDNVARADRPTGGGGQLI